ncbi:MAG: hypothetical protein ACRYGR_03340 [Janthinobacterium lividum]
MNISFRPLLEVDFSQLLKWLRQSHVQKWWDTNVFWTLSLVKEKYKTYVHGYKLEKGNVKKIQSMIICCEGRSIGYIQCYDAYDFTRSVALKKLPISLACLDI